MERSSGKLCWLTTLTSPSSLMKMFRGLMSPDFLPRLSNSRTLEVISYSRNHSSCSLKGDLSSRLLAISFCSENG